MRVIRLARDCQEEAMERLIEGYRRFRETYWQEHSDVFQALAGGQNPRAMIIACCDSRVDPQLIFDARPGEIFVVRNVANLVPPYNPNRDYHGTSAALEFAVTGLKVEHIVVMGHAQCGGVRALLHSEDGQVGDFIGSWMQIAKAARTRALSEAEGDEESAQRICEHETVRISIKNLMTFPWIRERVENGTLTLHGWYFAIETGDLVRL
jgi:carbonic anhydrase